MGETMTEDHVRVLVTSILNGKLDRKVDETVCTIKHREVADLKKMVIAMLMLQFTTLAGVIFALIKGL